MRSRSWKFAVLALIAVISVLFGFLNDSEKATWASVESASAFEPVVPIKPEDCPAYAAATDPPDWIHWAALAKRGGGIPPNRTEGAATASSRRPVFIEIGADIQEVVELHPPGTTFALRSGVHIGQTIRLRDGDTLWGEPGAVLSGEGRVEHAFTGSGEHLTICGLIIENYVNGPGSGAINAEGTGWRVLGNEIRYNVGVGVTLMSGFQVIGNSIHHNGQIGIKGPGDGVLIQNNEIAFNNYRNEHDMSWEAGGAKFVRTNDLVVRGNYVHDNHGHGLWTDGNNLRSLYEGNVVVDNYGAGIFHEISYDAIIRDNQVEGNAHQHAEGGIRVTSSPNVEIFGNSLARNNGGIYVSQNDRGAGLHGRYLVENLWVHDNAISFTTGWSGLRAGDGGRAVYVEMNNRFDRNTYRLPQDATPFFWMNREQGVDQWRSYGQDPNGTFS